VFFCGCRAPPPPCLDPSPAPVAGAFTLPTPPPLHRRSPRFFLIFRSFFGGGFLSFFLSPGSSQIFSRLFFFSFVLFSLFFKPSFGDGGPLVSALLDCLENFWVCLCFFSQVFAGCYKNPPKSVLSLWTPFTPSFLVNKKSGLSSGFFPFCDVPLWTTLAPLLFFGA